LGVYAAKNGSFLLVFRDNQFGTIGCRETSVINYNFAMRKIPLPPKAQTSNIVNKFSVMKFLLDSHLGYSPSRITVQATFRSCSVSITYDEQLRQ